MDNARKVKLFGDRIEAMRKYGEGQSLLRATKSIAELMGFPFYRLFSSDKLVMAQSIPGVQDQITLNVPEILEPEEEELKPYCSINFINLPTEIPPMKWYAPGQEIFTKVGNAWVIKDPNGVVEVEGIDYLKTYYRLNITDCNECSPFISTVCKTNEITLARCHPYTYDAAKLLYQGGPVPYFQGWPDRVPPVLPDPENHLIHSFYESGQAEILKFDHDSQGPYFLWKAYTEWGSYPPTDITFSRTGLGYLLLKAFIQFEGMELCKAETIIKVDCCLKPVNDRKVEIWWEDFGTCQPYINYPGVVYNALCKMPTEVSIVGTSGLIWYGCTEPQQPLYAIPEILGSCLPVEWTLSGPIELWNSDKNDSVVFFKCLEGGCNDPAMITLRDRCGSVYVVRGKPCCEEAAALSINYTSLLMSCNQQQTFTAIGGCAPYSWVITAGGGTLSTNTGGSTVYTSPATNPNCTSNPTITLTDCCGNSAQVSLAVNCYSPPGLALIRSTYTQCGGCYDNDPPYCFMMVQAHWETWQYNCDGILTDYCITNPACTSWTYLGFRPGCTCYVDHCWTASCGGHTPDPECGVLYDERTVALKAAGCCPINPFTGLPYD